MAKIKHTKNELKTQREALARYERFLPMLQLKKQQLQTEIQSIDHRIEQNTAEEQQLLSDMVTWIELFSEPAGISDLIHVKEIRIGKNNIAGVDIPVLEDVVFRREEVDLFLTPPWIDKGLDVLEQLLRVRVKDRVLKEQRKLVGDELKVTSQRVNLFEKVKIPESRENIRVIRIFLGDEQTAAVVRAKIAKSRTVEFEYANEAA